MPYDSGNTTATPWLMENHANELLLDPLNGKKLSAEYIWSLSGQDRIDLVDRVFKYLREHVPFSDLVTPELTPEEIQAEYVKLKKFNHLECLEPVSSGEIKQIKNSNSVCTNVLKCYTGELFYSAKGNAKKSYSAKDVYETDELLLKVLKNRMGWNVSKEDGMERPYVFAISKKMIVQGIRSSGLGYSVSTFKPAVAKLIYKEYGKNGPVFDFSSGWGARAMGAGSCGMDYYGIDPLTADNVNTLMSDLSIGGRVHKGGSEDAASYQALIESGMKQNSCSVAFSSPPYFDLEVYDQTDQGQSVVQYSEYNGWLKGFWEPTVQNVINFVLRPGGKFIFVIVNMVDKHEIAKDMKEICLQNGLVLTEELRFKTSKSHLSGKKKSGETSKTTEFVYVFEKE